MVLLLHDLDREDRRVTRNLAKATELVLTALPSSLHGQFKIEAADNLRRFNPDVGPLELGEASGCLWGVMPSSIGGGFVLLFTNSKDEPWTLRQAIAAEQKFPTLRHRSLKDCRIYAVLGGKNGDAASKRSLDNWYASEHWSKGLEELD